MSTERDNMNMRNLFIKKQEISCWLLSYLVYCYNGTTETQRTVFINRIWFYEYKTKVSAHFRYWALVSLNKETLR
jgi:hypothetical protein